MGEDRPLERIITSHTYTLGMDYQPLERLTTLSHITLGDDQPLERIITSHAYILGDNQPLDGL